MIYLFAFITFSRVLVTFSGHLHFHLHVHLGSSSKENGNVPVPARPNKHRKTLDDNNEEKKRLKRTPPPPQPVKDHRSKHAVFFWMLVLQDPQAYCNSSPLGCERGIPDGFKIHSFHALHESKKAFTTPKKTIRDKFLVKMTEVSQLADALQEQWPHLGSEDHFSFLEAQFRKHGYITGLAPLEYFSKALEMKATIDRLSGGGLEFVFGGANVQRGQAYGSISYCDPVQECLHAVPRLKCNNVELLEVQVCSNLTLHLIDCNVDRVCECYGCDENNIVYASSQ